MARKIVFLAQQARLKTAAWLERYGPFDQLQWDELHTFEHSRLKPLSVAVMTCTRCILGYGVASMPARGNIARHAREKYGRRRDRTGSMRRRVLKQVAANIVDTPSIKTDEYPRYARELKQVFPSVLHTQHRSIRGSLIGQGELKRTGYDPLWGVNHTLAMMRDNIKRFARSTWCTSKLASSLDDVIAVYLHYHNTVLIPEPAPKEL